MPDVHAGIVSRHDQVATTSGTKMSSTGHIRDVNVAVRQVMRSFVTNCYSYELTGLLVGLHSQWERCGRRYRIRFQWMKPGNPGHVLSSPGTYHHVSTGSYRPFQSMTYLLLFDVITPLADITSASETANVHITSFWDFLSSLYVRLLKLKSRIYYVQKWAHIVVSFFCTSCCRFLYPFWIQSDNILAVQAAGAAFTDGVSKEDFHIVIDSANCTIESFTANEIDCRPPIRAPAFDKRFRYNNISTLRCHQNSSFHVQVSKISLRLITHLSGWRLSAGLTADLWGKMNGNSYFVILSSWANMMV